MWNCGAGFSLRGTSSPPGANDVETSRRTQVRRRLKSAPHLLICLFLLLPLCHAAKDEVVAAGQIERIMDRSITIRRADGVLVEARLLHTGKLRADVLVTKFHFGDNVEMACKAIPPVWDDDARLYRVLELERIDLLKKPSANEYYIAASSRAWREPGNMLKLLHPEFVPKMEAGERAVDGPPEARQTFEQARQVNLKYVAAIPTYMADETATRATADSVPPRWRPIDVILADVTFHGDMETRDQVFSNNRLIPGGMKDVKGLRWEGAFVSRLKPLFDADCPVAFKFVQTTTVKGRQLVVFEFHAPADSCFSPAAYSYLRYYAPWTGKVS